MFQIKPIPIHHTPSMNIEFQLISLPCHFNTNHLICFTSVQFVTTAYTMHFISQASCIIKSTSYINTFHLAKQRKQRNPQQISLKPGALARREGCPRLGIGLLLRRDHDKGVGRLSHGSLRRALLA